MEPELTTETERLVDDVMRLVDEIVEKANAAIAALVGNSFRLCKSEYGFYAPLIAYMTERLEAYEKDVKDVTGYYVALEDAKKFVRKMIKEASAE